MVDWTKVQSKIDNTGNGTTRGVAFTSPVSAGSAVVGACLVTLGAVLTGVTDDKGNIYVLTAQGQQAGGNSANGFRSLHLINNGPQTLTFHYSAGGNTDWVAMQEFAPPTGTTDISLDGSQIILNTNALATANYSIKNSDVLQVAYCFSSGTATTGAGWTADLGSGTAQCSEWKIQATSTTTATGAFATQTGTGSEIISFGIAPVARTAWEMRQSAIQRSVTNATSGSVTLPAPVTAGNIVVGSIAVGTPTGPTLAAGLTSFTDNKSNNYSLVPSTLGNVSGDRQIFWSGGMLNNGPQTITANFNAAEAIIFFLAAEFVPPPGTASVAVDTGSGVNTTDTNTSETTTTTPNLTTLKNGDLLYSYGDIGGNTTSPNNGLQMMDGQGQTWCQAWGVQAAAGAVAITWTHPASASGGNNTSLAAFSATAGGGQSMWTSQQGYMMRFL